MLFLFSLKWESGFMKEVTLHKPFSSGVIVYIHSVHIKHINQHHKLTVQVTLTTRNCSVCLYASFPWQNSEFEIILDMEIGSLRRFTHLKAKGSVMSPSDLTGDPL